MNTELTVYEDLLQGSDEWLQARCGLVTASTIDGLITSKTVRPAHNDTQRAILARVLSERILNKVEPQFTSNDMLRGIYEEPIARDAYSEWSGSDVAEVGFITTTCDEYTLGYSPDGLVGDDGLIEIKSRAPKHQLQTILADQVPTYYVAQCQAGLFVTGRAWLDYVSFCGGLPLFVKRVLPDPKWQETIHNTMIEFEQTITELKETYEARAGNMPVMEETFFDAEIVVH